MAQKVLNTELYEEILIRPSPGSPRIPVDIGTGGTVNLNGDVIAEFDGVEESLGAPADAAASSDNATSGLIGLVKRGLQNWTTLLTRIPTLTLSGSRLQVDGSGVTQPVSGTVATTVAVRSPTTTSVASSASSVTILAANANRRGCSIANDSTATLRLSFSTPATTANAFLVLPPGAFILLDQQMIVTGIIYGIWSAANGTAQVTEYV